jgi:hypothetical protein
MLSLDLVSAAHPLREGLALRKLIQFRLPVHSRAPVLALIISTPRISLAHRDGERLNAPAGSSSSA